MESMEEDNSVSVLSNDILYRCSMCDATLHVDEIYPHDCFQTYQDIRVDDNNIIYPVVEDGSVLSRNLECPLVENRESQCTTTQEIVPVSESSFTEKFIDYYRERECLWNLRCAPELRTSAAKEKAWNEISVLLSESVPVLKKKWKYLMDTHRRIANSSKCASGSSAPKKINWSYWETLSFLRDVDLQNRQTGSNLQAQHTHAQGAPQSIPPAQPGQRIQQIQLQSVSTVQNVPGAQCIPASQEVMQAQLAPLRNTSGAQQTAALQGVAQAQLAPLRNTSGAQQTAASQEVMQAQLAPLRNTSGAQQTAALQGVAQAQLASLRSTSGVQQTAALQGVAQGLPTPRIQRTQLAQRKSPLQTVPGNQRITPVQAQLAPQQNASTTQQTAPPQEIPPSGDYPMDSIPTPEVCLADVEDDTPQFKSRRSKNKKNQDMDKLIDAIGNCAPQNIIQFPEFPMPPMPPTQPPPPPTMNSAFAALIVASLDRVTDPNDQAEIQLTVLKILNDEVRRVQRRDAEFE